MVYRTGGVNPFYPWNGMNERSLALRLNPLFLTAKTQRLCKGRKVPCNFMPCGFISLLYWLRLPHRIQCGNYVVFRPPRNRLVVCLHSALHGSAGSRRRSRPTNCWTDKTVSRVSAATGIRGFVVVSSQDRSPGREDGCQRLGKMEQRWNWPRYCSAPSGRIPTGCLVRYPTLSRSPRRFAPLESRRLCRRSDRYFCTVSGKIASNLYGDFRSLPFCRFSFQAEQRGHFLFYSHRLYYRATAMRDKQR